MACFAPCDYKKEVSRLRKQLEALDPSRVEKKLEKACKDVLRAVNERDNARRKAEQSQKTAIQLREKIESLKDRLVWLEEEIADAKESWASEKKKLKHRIGELEKELSTAVWRIEKQERDAEKYHKKAMAKQEEEYKAKLQETEKKYNDEISKKDAIIKALAEQLGKSVGSAYEKKEKKGAGACGIKADSTNSSTSPGQDPNHATIPNNRERSGLKPGAQENHKPQNRKKMKPDNTILLPPPQAVLADPDAYYEIGEVRKQVVSVRIAVEVTEYVGKKYRNHKTRGIVHSEFPEGVGHLEVNYDESVEAFAAFLHTVCNVPYNKVKELFNEAVEGGRLQLSTGKLAGLEKKFSALSEKERADIWNSLFCSRIMNIDGTQMRINGRQRQILVMRSGDAIMYKMTGCKGDKAIAGTPAEHYQGTVVSDGEPTFTKLGTRHQGCLVHEGRYVRHALEVMPDLSWHKEMRELFGELQHCRNEGLAKGIKKMAQKEREDAQKRYTIILRKGIEEYSGVCRCLLHQQLLSNEKRLLPFAGEYSLDYGAIKQEHADEAEEDIAPEVRKALQKDINTMIRLIADKKDYLLFLEDYTIPPHNNDAEKAARTVKVHAKPNGGMRSDEYAGFYADTATVTETEHAQGRSRFEKLKEVFRRGPKAIAEKMKGNSAKTEKIQ